MANLKGVIHTIILWARKGVYNYIHHLNKQSALGRLHRVIIQ